MITSRSTIVLIGAALIAACGSGGTNANGGGFVGTGAPGNSNGTPYDGQNPGSSAQNPGSSAQLPGSSQTPNGGVASCTALCAFITNYPCLLGNVTGSCVAACLSAAQSKGLSDACLALDAQVLSCLDKAGALKCSDQGDTLHVSDSAAALACVSAAPGYRDCVSITTSGSGGSGGQGGTGGMADGGTGGTTGGCTQASGCTGCQNACDTCLCTGGDATSCAGACQTGTGGTAGVLADAG